MRTFDPVHVATCKLTNPQECELELPDGTETLKADTVLSLSAPVRFVDEEPVIQFGAEDAEPLECGLNEDDHYSVLVCEGELNGNEYEFESAG